jgi:hypothetical protein
MCGIEKRTIRKSLTIMKKCPNNFGVVLSEKYSGVKHDQRDQYVDDMTEAVMAKAQIAWFIQKDDLLLSGQDIMSEKKLSFSFRETKSRLFSLPIYEYIAGAPFRFEHALSGWWLLIWN